MKGENFPALIFLGPFFLIATSKKKVLSTVLSGSVWVCGNETIYNFPKKKLYYSFKRPFLFGHVFPWLSLRKSIRSEFFPYAIKPWWRHSKGICVGYCLLCISILPMLEKSINILAMLAMMACRWREFKFSYSIPPANQVKFPPCPRCFAEVMLLGSEMD